MADRIYPSKAAAGAAAPSAKSHMYNPTRPLYRHQPPRRHSSGCFCRLCCCFILLVLSLVILVAAAGAALWLVYRPHRPTFSVASFSLSTLTVTPASKVDSKLNLAVTARNPNKELVYIYDPVSISVTTDTGIDIGDGSFPAFVHGKKNSTVLKASVLSTGNAVGKADADGLKKGLKSQNGVELKLVMETKVKAKMGILKTPKIRIRVLCDGIRVREVSVKEKGKKRGKGKEKVKPIADTSGAKCASEVRVKVWKWTF